MIHNAINQFLQSTAWGELDYLIVDLPPGTSDSPLTVMQTVPVDGFIVVSTPQDLAIIDAKRCINMIRKLNLNVVGVVENYSGDVFGEGAGRQLAEDIDAPFLGSMSLRGSYRDTSRPTVLVDDTVGEEYAAVADELRSSLNLSVAKPRQRPRSLRRPALLPFAEGKTVAVTAPSQFVLLVGRVGQVQAQQRVNLPLDRLLGEGVQFPHLPEFPIALLDQLAR